MVIMLLYKIFVWFIHLQYCLLLSNKKIDWFFLNILIYFGQAYEIMIKLENLQFISERPFSGTK